MQMYELRALMKNSYLKKKDEWEIGRFISYMVAQVNSTKKLTMDQVLKFPWEEDDKKNKEAQIVTKQQREELIRKSKEMEKILFGDK